MAKKIGIIGAGKLGMVLAQLATKAGYDVYVSGSGSPEKIRLTVETLAPGAQACTTEEATKSAKTVILALPLGKVRQLKSENFTGKLVIDATNYWWEVDGPRSEIVPDSQSSSEAVQTHLAGSRVVKSFSHMGYHDLHDEARQEEELGRKALAVAGDDENDVAAVEKVVRDFGFEPVVIGPLASGRRLEPGSPVFGASLERAGLQRLLAE